LQTVCLEARKERAWNSPEAHARRAVREANERAAMALLESATPHELDEHIVALKAALQVKREAYHAVMNALAKALNQKLWRRESRG
jgi:nitrate reductase assembly molybdenum cofactor insertion protein NarJ